MKMQDLMKMDGGEVLDWLIENHHDFELVKKPQVVESPEDIGSDSEVLCWDGCEWSIDYVDTDVETGCCFMANGTQVEMYCELPPNPYEK